MAGGLFGMGNRDIGSGTGFYSFVLIRSHDLLMAAPKLRSAAQNSVEIFQRFANAQAFSGLDLELANRPFVIPASLLNYGHGLLDFSVCLKVTQIDHRIAEVAQIDRNIERAD